MKQELTKYPKMKLVSIVYGNDDPPTATQVTEGLLEKYPNLKGIISPTTVGILAAAQVVATPKWKGKVIVTGLGTPDEMKAYVADGVAPAFILWNPANLGYLAAYAAVNLASKKITNARPDLHRGQARQVHNRSRSPRSSSARPPCSTHPTSTTSTSKAVSRCRANPGPSGRSRPGIPVRPGAPPPGPAPARPPGPPGPNRTRGAGRTQSRWSACASLAGSGRNGSTSTGPGTGRCGRR